jgi:AAA+ superfamily predicted ATPase
MGTADLGAMGDVLVENSDSIIPLAQMFVLIGTMVLAWWLWRRYIVESEGLRGRGIWMVPTLPGLALCGSFAVAAFGMDLGISPPGYLTMFMLIIGAWVVFLGFLGARIMFPSTFSEQRSDVIGTRVGEMLHFRGTTFENVGGLRSIKSELKDALMVPLLQPEISTRFGVQPPRGILLFGPPGCGKTLLMRAVASELNVEMIGVKCSDLMSKWYGESEGAVAGLFSHARKHAPCILFLDEIDAITKRRDFYSTDDVTPRILSIMLAEMDGMDAAEGIIIVGSTNKPEMVDPALMRPGRFDKVIYVPPPELESRRIILGIHLRGKPLATDVNLDAIARATEGFSGADLANLVTEAATLAMHKAMATGHSPGITQGDFDEMLSQIQPSITKDMIKEYMELRNVYQRKTYKSITGSGDVKGPARAGPEVVGDREGGTRPPPPGPPHTGGGAKNPAGKGEAPSPERGGDSGRGKGEDTPRERRKWDDVNWEGNVPGN